jgi:hypothetical protein
MADHYGRMDGPKSPPQMGATPRHARLSWAIMAAIVVVLGLVFYGISANQTGQKVANQPAVIAAPAPAAGVAPPAPQTTTGEAVPSTTGRGGAPSPGQH